MEKRNIFLLFTTICVLFWLLYFLNVPISVITKGIHSTLDNIVYKNETVHDPALSLDIIHHLPNVIIYTGSGRTVHHIISAYYDSRELPNRPAIIMFGFVEKRLGGNLYCALVYEDSSIECIGNVTHSPYNAPNDRNSLSELYFCRTTSKDKIPTHVVLTDNENCQSNQSKLIPVWNTERTENTYDVGVCIGSPLFTTSSVSNQRLFDRMVEFLAMVKVQGVQIVTAYNWNMKQELIVKILKLYPELLDVVQWEKITVKLHYYAQNEMLCDCLYRNMNRVKYLAFIDLDEFIFPVSNYSLMDMLQILEKEGKYASYTFSNHFMDITPIASSTIQSCLYLRPKYFVRLKRHNWPESRPDRRTKLIVIPYLLSAMGVHDVWGKTVKGYKKTFLVPDSTAMMFHYRDPLYKGLILGKGTQDRTALKYKDEVMEEMKRVCTLIHT